MRIAYISLALMLVVLSALLPTPPGLTKDAQIMLGILAMAVILWITEAIPAAATGLLIMTLQPLLKVVDAKEVFSSFGNKAVFFILASFMLAAAIEKYGLHKRLAVKLLKIFGNSPKMFIFGIMLTGAFLSFIMQEHAVAALLLPILTHILISNKIVPKESNFGIVTMLSLTYGVSIGSWGTLLGGARNPLTIAFLEEIGYSISFLDWMKLCMPIVFISLPLATFILLRLFPPEAKNIGGAIKHIEEEVYEMGKIGKNEKILICLVATTIFLWIFFSDYLGIAVIALASSSSLFILRLIEWEDIEKRVQWGIILLYGGAITLGKGLEKTQAVYWLSSKIAFFRNEYIILIFIILLTFLLTNLMSNTAAVATMLPIAAGIASQIGMSKIIACMSVAIAGGGAFLFVVGTPSMAIAYSSGYVSLKHMAKAGTIVGIVCMLIIFAIAIFYWQYLLGL